MMATINGATALTMGYVVSNRSGCVSTTNNSSHGEDSSPDDNGQLGLEYDEPPEIHHQLSNEEPLLSPPGTEDFMVGPCGVGKTESCLKRPASPTLPPSFVEPLSSTATSSQERSSKKRRKQSNPVRLPALRVCSSGDSSTHNAEIDEFAEQHQHQQEALFKEIHNSQQNSGEVSPDGMLHDEHGSSEVAVGMSQVAEYEDGRIYRCPHCNMLFEDEEQLREHIEDEHVQKALERQIQQQSQKNFSSNVTASQNNSPFDLSASSMTLRLDSHTSDNSSSSDPSTILQSDDKSVVGSLLSHHLLTNSSSNTTITPSSSVPALHSPKDMASLMMANLSSTFGSAPFLIPVLPCGNTNSTTNSRLVMGPGSTSTAINLTPTVAPPIRIFNPEAFCELCNKEFCNKYFLKTHKANKHGIYSAEVLSGVCSASTVSGLPSPITQVASCAGSSSGANKSNRQENCSAIATSGCNSSPGGNITVVSISSGSNSGCNSTSSGNANQVSTGGTGMLITHSSTNLVPKTLPVMNPEAFCDICQKEFCNKYFLRKHRQKIHGIHDMVPSGGSPFGNPTVSTSTNTSIIADSLSMTANTEANTSNLTTTTAIGNSTHHPLSQPSLPDLYEYGVRDLSAKIAAFTQSLLPKHSIQNIVTPNSTTTTITSTASSTVMSNSTISTVPASHFTSGIGGSAEKQQGGGIIVAGHVFSHERLREMGVINVDAFCEICCKEFCNKYFLRTHKMNKHGIGSVGGAPCGIEGLSSTFLPGMLGFPPPFTSMPHSQQQSVPLSLVMEKAGEMVDDGRKSATPASSSSGSSTTNGAGVTVINCGQRLADQARPPSGSQELLLPHDSINSTTADLTCEVCSRPFSSAYLLKMHKFYFHNIGDPNSSPPQTNGSAEVKISPPSPENSTEGRCGSSNSLKSLTMENTGGDVGSGASEALAAVVAAASGGQPLNEDLQKLQTMIHELNTSPSKDGSNNAKCNICLREMKNKYFLRAHMMNEHGELHNEEENLRDGVNSIGGSTGSGNGTESEPIVSLSSNHAGTRTPIADPESFCEHCCKEFCSKYFLQIHKMNVHGLSVEKLAADASLMTPIPLPVPLDKIKTEGANITSHSHTIVTQTNSVHQQLPHLPLTSNIPIISAAVAERPPITAVTGRNFCEICNKELCNKYFMKTHMLKMHGINVDDIKSGVNGATIGGVTCDICQKELCSKYFLKVHKQNTHGIFEEPAMTKESYVAAAAAAAAASTAAAAISITDKDGVYHSGSQNAGDGNMSDGGSGSGNRYFSHYTEVCPLCDRRFKSIKWLKTHVINDHAELAKENGLMEVLGAAAECHDLLPGVGGIPRIHHMISRDYACLSADQLFGAGGNKGDKPSSSSSSATTSPNTSNNSPYTLHHAHHHHHHRPGYLPHYQSGHHMVGPTENSEGMNESTSTMHHVGELGSTGAVVAGTAAVGTGSANTSVVQQQVGTSTSSSSSSPSSASSILASVSTTAPLSTFPNATVGCAGGGSGRKLLSSSGTSGTRIYHCSYCSYSTRWLSNLYAHEKRHTGLSSEGEKRFCCRICHRAYRYNHSLQRHLVSHKTTGILLKHVVSNVASVPHHPVTTSATTTAHHHQQHQHHHQQSLTSAMVLQHLQHPISSITQQQEKEACDGVIKETSLPVEGVAEPNANMGKIIPTTLGKVPPSRVKKYRCSKCGAKYRSREQCLEHIHQHHNTRNRNHHHSPRVVAGTGTGSDILDSGSSSPATTLTTKSSSIPMNCPLCPFFCNSRKELASHLRKHQSGLENDGGNGAEDQADRSDDDESSGTAAGQLLQQQHQLQQLQQAFGRSQQQQQLPMTYAVPQTPPTAGSFIMQPFLIAQSNGGGNSDGAKTPPSSTFVPSLVYLPVSHKVNETVTVAFNLTPA